MKRGGRGDSIGTTANHEPILTLDPAMPVAAPMPTEISKGVAKGVVVQGVGSASSLSRALSVDEFKNHVRSAVESSQ